MTQDAVVTRLLSNSMAEVVVKRQTACGSNCSNCESCIFQSEIKAIARNTIHARPGQHVVIESQTSKVFSALVFVYILPLVLFLLGYLISYLLRAPEGICILVSFLGLIVSAAMLIGLHKRLFKIQEIRYEIIS